MTKAFTLWDPNIGNFSLSKAIDATGIGQSTPTPVAATTLSSSGAATLASLAVTGASVLTGAVSGAGFLAALLAWFQTDTGTVVANGATPVAVADTGVTASSQIFLTLKTVGGTPAAVFVSAITAGTGFSINSLASNTSTYNYVRIG